MKTNSAAIVIPPAGSPGSASEDIRDIKPPLEISGGLTWLFWALLAALLAIAIVAFLWRKKRKSAPAEMATEPQVPAHERAQERLMRALSLIGQPNPFCTEVSNTLRLYLEERFELRAPERTTEEFLEELQQSPLLPFEQKRALGDFLVRCDLVKFARYEPGEPELRELHTSAVRLVQETSPAPEGDAETKLAGDNDAAARSGR